jgi:hypothetical protein
MTTGIPGADIDVQPLSCVEIEVTPISELHGSTSLGLSPADKHRAERLYRRALPVH